MAAYKITYGGWYQRTTIHLSEIYNFFAFSFTQTDLDKDKLKQLQGSLNLVAVSREVGYLEFVKAITKEGIEIRYYEDGLYILTLVAEDIKKGQEVIERYFEQIFSPAIAYLFSLGAPTPKILANIRSVHPTVVTLGLEKPESFEIDQDEFGKIYSQVKTEVLDVYKTQHYIFLIYKVGQKRIEELVDMQIFFREYKDQLEKYLNIHRKIWEEIEEIKEKKQMKGSEVDKVRSKLDSYEKTVYLINNRIIQMESYIPTRQQLASELEVEGNLNHFFRYKFETLADSRDYIEELWEMTANYLESAIKVVVEVKNESTKNSIGSLTVITTLGVVSSLLAYLSTDSLPKITAYGIVFFIILVSITFAINRAIRYFFKNIKYKMTLAEVEKNL